MNPSLVTTCKAKPNVWMYLMMQCNLKPGLHRFGTRGKDAVISEMAQLHVMDTWRAMDPSKRTREDMMKTAVPKGEMHWKGKRKSMYQWGSTKGVYFKGGGNIAYHDE